MGKVIVSAGDALTARLVEEAGFDGIWVSGFEVCARLGIPDNGTITRDEMLIATKPIVKATRLPVYVDVDTGYEDFHRTVIEFERIGVKGVCIEDNVVPKTNSLWGGKLPLMDADEFGNKISVVRGRMEIIARTEAIIRGYGLEEAERRLRLYYEYGADILLPHSRDSRYIFCADMPAPMAIVPTKFPEYTNEALFKLGYSMVIWANQTERVKIKSIREALRILKQDDSAFHIEDRLSVTLDDMKGLMPDG